MSGKLKPLRIGRKFDIPWNNPGLPSKWTAFKWRAFRQKFNYPSKEEVCQNKYLNPMYINKENNNRLVSESDSQMKFTWLTHATTFTSFNNFNVISDPQFSDMAGPFWVRFLANLDNCKCYGIRPCGIEDLPHVHAVIISHDHFDHLDIPSVKMLNEKYGKELLWFAPLGYKSWFNKFGIENVTELNWWDEALYDLKKKKVSLIEPASASYTPINDPDHVILSLCPSQHWASRLVIDLNHQLWGSWVVRNKNFKYFFAGDTGYCDIFKTIGNVYDGFDVSAIPIGAYEPRYLMKNEHVNPDEAVKIHEDLLSERSMAIHWGSFHFSDEGFFQPPEDLLKILEEKPLNKGTFQVPRIGETFVIEKK